MAVTGKPRTFYKKYKFVVEIDGVKVAAFTKAGPLEPEVAVAEQYEGGSLIPVKEPARVKVANLVLERGATDDLDLWTWFEQVANLAANSGLVSPQYKRNLDIVAQARDGSTLRRWRCYNAFPIKFHAGDWDNDSDENVVETVELAYDFPLPLKTAQ